MFLPDFFHICTSIRHLWLLSAPDFVLFEALWLEMGDLALYVGGSAESLLSDAITSHVQLLIQFLYSISHYHHQVGTIYTDDIRQKLHCCKSLILSKLILLSTFLAFLYRLALVKIIM